MLFTVLPHSELTAPEGQQPSSDIPPPKGPAPSRAWRLSVLALSILLILSSLAIAVSAVVVSRRHALDVVPGVVVFGPGGGQPLGRVALTELPGRIHELGERFLDQRVRLHYGHDK